MRAWPKVFAISFLPFLRQLSEWKFLVKDFFKYWPARVCCSDLNKWKLSDPGLVSKVTTLHGKAFFRCRVRSDSNIFKRFLLLCEITWGTYRANIRIFSIVLSLLWAINWLMFNRLAKSRVNWQSSSSRKACSSSSSVF